MKAFILIFLCFLSLAIFAQDTLLPPLDTPAKKTFVNQLTSPADSAAIIQIAEQFGVQINPNATPVQIAAQVFAHKSLFTPKSASDWVTLIVFLIAIAGSLFFMWRRSVLQKAHNALKVKAATGGIVVALLLVLGLGSCKATTFVKDAGDFLIDHCPSTKVTNPLTGNATLHFECDSVWPTAPLLNAGISQLDICINASTGVIYGDFSASDTAALNKVLAVLPTYLKAKTGK